MSGKLRAGISILLALLLLFLALPLDGQHDDRNAQAEASLDAPASSGSLSLAIDQSMSEAEEAFNAEEPSADATEATVVSTALPYDGFVPGTEVEMPESDKPYMIVIYIGSQRVVVYEKDEEGHYTVPHYVFTVSTGLGNNTIRGTYKIQHRWRWLPMHGIYCQYVTQWSGNYLFHSVMYSRTNPSTIDRDAYSRLGQKASAGCIRMTVRDAKWIWDNCEWGTYVISTNDKMPEGLPGSEGVPAMTLNVRWDPTDPDERNPYLQQTENTEAPAPVPTPMPN